MSDRGHALEQQFDRILTEHSGALSRLAYGYETEASVREELVQEIALAIWQARPYFRGECSERTFVFRIAHNRGLTHVWRWRPAHQPLDDLDEADQPVDPRSHPDERFAQIDQRARLMEAIQSLSVVASTDDRVDARGFVARRHRRDRWHHRKQCSCAAQSGQESFKGCNGSQAMIEDRELKNWREEWVLVAKPSPDLSHKVRQKIERQNRRFVIGNVVTLIAFIGLLFFARFMRTQAGWMGAGWATGICVLVFVSVALRVWSLRGTWSAEVQSTRGFLELWRKRVEARLRLLRVSVYVSVGWLVSCGILTVVNWPVIGRDVKARPTEWIEVLVLCVLMEPVIWYWALWAETAQTG